MVLLITKSVVASKLQTAIGYAESEFNTFINEAQEFDFKPLVNENFYFDLLEKRNDPVWKKLIDGGEYVYNSRTLRFQGLSTVLSYFAYARYFLSSPAVATSHGIVIKTTPNSQPVSLEDRRNVYYKKQEEANLMFEDVKKFIERNINDYPSWNENSCLSIFNGPSQTRVIQ